jgi:uncharacterized membrane protein
MKLHARRRAAPRVDLVGIGRAVGGIVLLALLPGWVWSLLLLPTLGRMDRLVVSIALSIALMVLALYLGSAVAGIAVTATHAVWWSATLTLAAWAALGLQRRKPTPSG